MAIILRGRHAGYTPAGIPIVRELPSDVCVATPGEYYGLRHVNYKPDNGIPILAHALKCCDFIDHCDKVETDCLAGGIWPHIGMYAFAVENCQSALGQTVALTYCKTPGVSSDDPDCVILDCPDPPPDPPSGCTSCDQPDKGKWRGSLALRGGTLSFDVCCFLNSSGDLMFRLIWRGCDAGCVEVFPDCTDPVFVNFGNITVNDCCDCTDSAESGTINLYLAANCHPVVNARHVSYTPSGIPIVARESQCAWSQNPVTGCNPHCGLVATIAASGDCACLNTTFSMHFMSFVGTPAIDPYWEALSVGSCGSPATVTMTCHVNLDGDGNPDGTLTLQLDIVCGATNTGTDTVIILDGECEDLDVTFNVEMTDPTAIPGACGTCTFQWSAMAMSWSTISSNCTGTCVCVDALTLDPGSVDGETQTLDCIPESPPACCLGTISVRVTR